MGFFVMENRYFRVDSEEKGIFAHDYLLVKVNWIGREEVMNGDLEECLELTGFKMGEDGNPIVKSKYALEEIDEERVHELLNEQREEWDNFREFSSNRYGFNGGFIQWN